MKDIENHGPVDNEPARVDNLGGDVGRRRSGVDEARRTVG